MSYSVFKFVLGTAVLVLLVAIDSSLSVPITPSTTTTSTTNTPCSFVDITTSSMTELRTRVNYARVQAQEAFAFTCQQMVSSPSYVCPILESWALGESSYPSFPANLPTDHCHLRSLLSTMYEVSFKYVHLIGQFARNMANEQTEMFGPHSAVYEKIRTLNTRMVYVLDQLLDLVPGVDPPLSLPSIINSGDVTHDNQRNVRISARVAAELDNMSSSLDAVLSGMSSSATTSAQN